MATGGGAPAPPRVPACPPELKCFFGCLVMLLRQMEARERAFAVEHARLQAEIEFLKREQRRRMEIAQDCIQEIRRSMSLKGEMEELLECKEAETRDPAFVGIGDLESFRICISTLADENTELKKKLKEVESQADLTENTVDNHHGSKDLRADIRKLKQAYKSMVSEKDREISVLRAEKGFAWNQFQSLEKDFRDTCSSKNIEIKRANEAAIELEKTVHELRLEVQEKDSEIGRLQEEVVSVNRKSKLAGPVSRGKSRIPHATPVRREVETPRKSVVSAKGTDNESGNNSRMHNTEERGQSQKRKHGSYTISHGLRRCSTRHQVRTSASPLLFTPGFTIPKLTAPTPPQL